MAVLYGISDIGANKSDPTEVTNPKVYCSGRSTSYHKLADTSNVVINSKPRSGLIRNIPPLGVSLQQRSHSNMKIPLTHYLNKGRARARARARASASARRERKKESERERERK